MGAQPASGDALVKSLFTGVILQGACQTPSQVDTRFYHDQGQHFKRRHNWGCRLPIDKNNHRDHNCCLTLNPGLIGNSPLNAHQSTHWGRPQLGAEMLGRSHTCTLCGFWSLGCLQSAPKDFPCSNKTIVPDMCSEQLGQSPSRQVYSETGTGLKHPHKVTLDTKRIREDTCCSHQLDQHTLCLKAIVGQTAPASWIVKA